MPFNGAGVFSRIYSWMTDQANGVLVRADRMDTDTDDIATGLSNCVTRDGQSPPTTNLPMGGFKWTGLGVGAAPTDSVTYSQVFNSPAFTTPSAVASPATSDNSLLLATTEYVTQKAFSAALPSQTGYSILTTNGVTASWSADQTGNAGKLLGTTGTTPTWTLPVGQLLYLNAHCGGF